MVKKNSSTTTSAAAAATTIHIPTRIGQSYISVPSRLINSLSSSSLESLIASPKKLYKPSSYLLRKFATFPNNRTQKLCLLFITLFLLTLLTIFKLGLFTPSPLIPCPKSHSQTSPSNADSKPHSQTSLSNADSKSHLGTSPNVKSSERDEPFNQETDQFWKQPGGMGYKPCLDFSEEFKKGSLEIVAERTKYLMVVVSGGMNQQRNQIVDAVIIARILKASFVVPIFQVNVIWADESEFSDVFDLEHFKRVLANDVHVVSSLPSMHLMTRPYEDKLSPRNVSPAWIRARYSKRIKRDGVLLLRGLDSRLSKDLPSDLQKLRCKVAFHALRFAPSILQLGNKIAGRMKSKGPYLSLHLRMEKDVWVRTGCLPGLGTDYDEMINNERKRRPELLTGRTNVSYHDRKLAGLCPLTALEVTRLLKALGAPKNARIYWAGGAPLGGKEALQPLVREFPEFYSKEDLALPGELEPFEKRASFMAAIDYIVCENSDVFMPSHGGNMGHAIQGHRAYAGHKKYITPNKRQMLPYFLNSTLSEGEFHNIIRELHKDSIGQPELRTSKSGRDVTKFPIPECMCYSSYAHNSH